MNNKTSLNNNDIINTITKQRNIITICATLLLLISLLLAIKIFSISEKIILIPSNNHEAKIIYDEKNIKDQYFINLSLDMLHLLLDIDKGNILENYKRLSLNFHPKFKHILIKQLKEAKEKVIDKKLSSFFAVDYQNIKINSKTKSVEIRGRFKTITQNTITSNEDKIFVIYYAFYQGRIWITSIIENNIENI